MATESAEAMKVFICYAREDKSLLHLLEKHLWPLRWQGLIETWNDQEISAGNEWESEIKMQLDAADIILLLVSPDFMASKYCYSEEMMHAMKQHERGEAYVVPIILHPVYWRGAPFSKLQALPTDAKPIISSSWHNSNEAFLSVVEGLSEKIEQLRQGKNRPVQKAKEDIKPLVNEKPAPKPEEKVRGKTNKELARRAFERGEKYIHIGQYDKALIAFEQAVDMEPTTPSFLSGKGLVLDHLKRYEEALNAYEQAAHFDSGDPYTQERVGDQLLYLKRYDEALAAYDRAIQLNPEPGTFQHSDAWKSKIIVLRLLGRSQEAQEASEQFERSLNFDEE